MRVAVAILMMLAFAAGAHAGVVIGVDGQRLQGAVQLMADGACKVADKTVPLTQALIVVANEDLQTLPAANALRLLDGQAMFGQVLAMSGKKVTFEFLGRRHELDVDRLWAIDLSAGVADGFSAAKTLYRQKDEPLPGTLLWIDAGRLAVDSPLGVLTLSRKGMSRYVFAAPQSLPLAEGEDEVRLIDHSILRGHLSGGTGGLELTHPLLGKLTLPASAITAIRRRPAGVAYPGEGQPEAKTSSLLSGVKTSPAAVSAGAVCDGPLLGRCAAQLRIEPQTVARYTLASPADQGGTLQATLAPSADLAGPVVLRLKANSQAVVEKKVSPDQKPEELSVPWPAASELVIEVDFDGQILLPAAVLLGDLRILRAK